MSILTALLPLSLIGQSAQAQPPAAPVTAPAPISAPTPGIIPAVAHPGEAKLIRIQSPQLPAPGAQPVVAMDRNAIIDRVGKALSDTKTVQGSFTQIDASGSPSSGVFYINRPGKVRFEYTKPEPMFIVSDGTTVSIDEPKRHSYDAVPLSSTPLHLFLRTNIDLKKEGSVTDVRSTADSHYVTLIDKSGEAEGKMILQFRASDFELIGWRQIDGSNAETTVKLADVKKNVALKASLFVVKDPNDAGDHR